MNITSIRPQVFFSAKTNKTEKNTPNLYNKPKYQVDDKQTATLYRSDEQANCGIYRLKLLKGVAKCSKEPIYKILNDCYEFTKKEFPGQKVTVFFNTDQIRNSYGLKYTIGVGVNSKAEEGVIRSEEAYPGFSSCNNSDFYYAKTVYSSEKEKIRYEELKKEVLYDLKNTIESYKEKGRA